MAILNIPKNIFELKLKTFGITKLVLGDPEVTANIYCKSRSLPNTDTQNYRTDLRLLLGHPVLLAVGK